MASEHGLLWECKGLSSSKTEVSGMEGRRGDGDEVRCRNLRSVLDRCWENDDGGRQKAIIDTMAAASKFHRYDSLQL